MFFPSSKFTQKRMGEAFEQMRLCVSSDKLHVNQILLHESLAVFIPSVGFHVLLPIRISKPVKQCYSQFEVLEKQVFLSH